MKKGKANRVNKTTNVNNIHNVYFKSNNNLSNIFLKVKGRGGQYVHGPFTQYNHNNKIIIKGLTDLHKKKNENTFLYEIITFSLRNKVTEYLSCKFNLTRQSIDETTRQSMILLATSTLSNSFS